MKNPQAFPQFGVVSPSDDKYDSMDFGGNGMTLRDYFESSIMSGFASNMSEDMILDIAHGYRGGKNYIKASKILAAGMLVEREKEEEND